MKELENAREQAAFWAKRVVELERAEAMNLADFNTRKFLARHKVEVTTPPNLVPPAFRVDGKPMGQCEFITYCAEQGLDIGIVLLLSR